MKEILTSFLIYAFGFAGIISVGLIPVRSCRALRQAFGVLGGQRKSFVGVALASVVSMSAPLIVLADIAITRRVFRCLSENYCGPSVGSGWVFLAMLGAGYCAFEILLFFFSKVLQGGGHKNKI